VALGLVALSHELWAVYGAAFLLSAFSVFFNPAMASVLPALVADDDLVGANSAIWSSAVISQIALAPVAGLLVAWAGAGPAFAVNAGSFLASAALLVGLRVPVQAATVASRRLALIAEGLRAIRSSRFLTTLAFVQAAAALSAGATSALLVVLAEEHLRVGPEQFGLLVGAIGLGAGIGPLVLQRVARDVRHRRWLFGPYLLRGAVDLVLAGSRSFGFAAGALAVYGVGTSTGMVTYNSVLQTVVPDRLRGRVFSFYDVVWQTSRLVSIGAGGYLADAIGIRAVYLFGGLLLVVAGVVGLRFGHVPARTPAAPDLNLD